MHLPRCHCHINEVKRLCAGSGDTHRKLFRVKSARPDMKTAPASQGGLAVSFSLSAQCCLGLVRSMM